MVFASTDIAPFSHSMSKTRNLFARTNKSLDVIAQRLSTLDLEELYPGASVSESELESVSYSLLQSSKNIKSLDDVFAETVESFSIIENAQNQQNIHILQIFISFFLLFTAYLYFLGQSGNEKFIQYVYSFMSFLTAGYGFDKLKELVQELDRNVISGWQILESAWQQGAEMRSMPSYLLPIAKITTCKGKYIPVRDDKKLHATILCWLHVGDIVLFHSEKNRHMRSIYTVEDLTLIGWVSKKHLKRLSQKELSHIRERLETKK